MDEHEKLREAQELAYDAMEASSAKERIALATKALKISNMCADAQLILAHEHKTPETRLPLLRSAVEAGERAIGPEAFVNDVGIFWGILETRPYMRARAALANALWDTGEHDEAVSHLKDMLRLNPNDNQGVREQLMTWLLYLRDIKSAETLIKQYEEATANNGYSNVVLQYLKHGASRQAETALTEAYECNRHLPFMLVKGPNKKSSDIYHYSLGSKEEAMIYREHDYFLWQSVDGLLGWLEAQVKVNGL